MTSLNSPPLRAVQRLSPQDWLAAAEKRLVSGGIDSVKIGTLAKDLGVTRGSFYWHFKDRDHLLSVMLDSWHSMSLRTFDDLLLGEGSSGMEEFLRLVHLWIDEENFDAAFEAAIRDWARVSEDVAEVVKDVDEGRIKACLLYTSDAADE